MGGMSSSHDWHPPVEPHAAYTASGSPVDYHMVASQVALVHYTECGCCPKTHINMDSEDLYAMLAEQFTKGYRLVYFTRRPGDLRMNWGHSISVFFNAFFRMNPNLGERLDGPVTWGLQVARSFLQSVRTSHGIFSTTQTSTVHFDKLVECISRNTQRGERLAAATVTGHAEGQSYGELTSGLSPHYAMDLFFEVPSPPTNQRYLYNIALIPVHLEYMFRGIVFFPEIQCDWSNVFKHHLSQGWRLIDIFIDVPLIEQMRIPHKRRRHFCKPTDTNALWIFERPASMTHDAQPLYEGTIVEQKVRVEAMRLGCKSAMNWLPLIQDMGSRGWELASVVESHKVDTEGWASTTITLNSLLFFQRPISHSHGESGR